jgi:hypothetical protein
VLPVRLNDGCQVGTGVPHVDHPSRFEEQRLDLIIRAGAVLDPAWYHEELTGSGNDVAIT